MTEFFRDLSTHFLGDQLGNTKNIDQKDDDSIMSSYLVVTFLQSCVGSMVQVSSATSRVIMDI